MSRCAPSRRPKPRSGPNARVAAGAGRESSPTLAAAAAALAALLAVVSPVAGSPAGSAAPAAADRAGATVAFGERLAGPSDGATGDQFGDSVAVSGDTIVVGARYHDAQGNDSGAAYVFVRPAGGWAGTLTETAKLLPTDGVAGDDFGASVAIDGGTIAVGAIDFRVPCGCPAVTVAVGAVYVLTEPTTGWAGTVMEDARLMASDPPNSFQPASLAISVAVAGDTVIAGDPFYDTVGGNDSGAAFVFVEPPGGWTGVLLEDAKLLASDGQSDELGTSVAASGTTIVAGAPLDDDAEFDAGAAYVFTEPAGGWGGTLFEDAKLVPGLSLLEGHFGRSFAFAGGQVAAGAYSQFLDEGAGYLYSEPPGGWAGVRTETGNLNATDGVAGDFFGTAVGAGSATYVVSAINARGRRGLRLRPLPDLRGRLRERRPERMVGGGAVRPPVFREEEPRCAPPFRFSSRLWRS